MIIVAGVGVLIWWAVHSYNLRHPRLSEPLKNTAIISVVTKYIDERDDAAGADQATFTSWLNAVKPIATKIWFNNLETTANSLNETIQSDYTTAHIYDLVVKAKISSCVIDLTRSKHLATNEAIGCPVIDSVVNQKNGATLSAKALLAYNWFFQTQVPYGKPTLAQLEMSRVNGQWLVSADTTGKGN